MYCGEQVIRAADIAIPLVKTSNQPSCEFNTNTEGGQWSVTIGWLIQLLGWTFATLFVAGFTGVIRKT